MVNDRQAEQRTTGAIDTAYGSYHVAIISIPDQYSVSSDLVKKLEQLRTDYDWQWATDKRQNPTPIIEKPEKTILKACQYAHCALVRDFRRHYKELVSVPGLIDPVDQLLSVAPREISIRFGQFPIDISNLRDFYLSNIHDPVSAAEVIGKTNSPDSLMKYTAHNCI